MSAHWESSEPSEHSKASPFKLPLRVCCHVRAAFTLVEILVSVVLLSVMVAFFGQMLSQAEKAWTQGESNKERMQNARAIVDFIGTELKAALLPVDRTDRKSLQFVVNPGALSPSYANRDAIFWQAPLATDRSLGDVAEIGYFIQWDLSKPDKPRSQMCRFFVNPTEVDSSNPANNLYRIRSAPDNWISDILLQRAASATAPGYQGLFAENVLGLWAECVDPAGAPITLDGAGAPLPPRHFDSRRGYSYRTASGVTRTSPPNECALPPAVELSLVLLDPHSAIKVRSAEQNAITNVVNSSSDAAAFVEEAQQNPDLKLIRAGLRSYQLTIHLQNSR